MLASDDQHTTLHLARCLSPLSSITHDINIWAAAEGRTVKMGQLGDAQDGDDVLLHLLGGRGRQRHQRRPRELAGLPAAHRRAGIHAGMPQPA